MIESPRKARAKIAAASRFRAPDDPELLAMRAELAAHTLTAHIERTLSTAPPLNAAQRDAIISAFGLVRA